MSHWIFKGKKIKVIEILIQRGVPLSSLWQNPEDYLSFGPDLIVVTKVKQKGWEGE